MPFINGKSYMNPAFGRSVESARAATAHEQDPPQKEQDGHWVTIAGRHVLIEGTESESSLTRQDQEHKSGATRPKHPKRVALPESGSASIYADSFDGKTTANGETFDQNKYTAALLPRSRWHALQLGTHVELTHQGNRVVVEVNDRGAGDKNPDSPRALDLSRAAASSLTGRDIGNDDESRKVRLMRLDKIRVVSSDIPLGPVKTR
jgi:rare lipoprotein A